MFFNFGNTLCIFNVVNIELYYITYAYAGSTVHVLLFTYFDPLLLYDKALIL